jgi:hypothetical protein
MTTRWLIQSEAAAHVRLCPRAFQEAVREGRFPAGKPASKSGRRKVWAQSELDAALMGRSDEQPAIADPIMAAIHAAEAEASKRRANDRKGAGVLVRPDQG